MYNTRRNKHKHKILKIVLNIDNNEKDNIEKLPKKNIYIYTDEFNFKTIKRVFFEDNKIKDDQVLKALNYILKDEINIRSSEYIRRNKESYSIVFNITIKEENTIQEDKYFDKYVSRTKNYYI